MGANGNVVGKLIFEHKFSNPTWLLEPISLNPRKTQPPLLMKIEEVMEEEGDGVEGRMRTNTTDLFVVLVVAVERDVERLDCRRCPEKAHRLRRIDRR